MLNNLTNIFNLITNRKVKTSLSNSDIITVGVKDANYSGNYQPAVIKYEDLESQILSQVSGGSFYTNGFTVVGCIAENITLPDNLNMQYTGPLSMCPGYTLTIPANTTLTIV